MSEEIGEVEEVQADEISEQTEPTEQPAQGETQDDAGSEDQPREGEEQVAEADGAQAAPQFDYTYKVKDEVKEYPDWIRPAIQSKEHEDYLRDLHTRADGLPSIKDKYEGLNNQVQSLIGLRNESPSDFIQAVNLKPEDAIDAFGKESLLKRFTTDELMEAWDKGRKLDEAPPEVKQALAANEQAESQLNQVNQTLAHQQQELLETRRFMVNQAFERDQVKSFAERYDAAYNKPGAFREYVEHFAKGLEKQTGRFAHPDVVLPQVMAQFSPFLDQQQPAANAGNQTQPEASAAPKPTIPNVGKSTSASPVTRSYKTFDEIQKLAANR